MINALKKSPFARLLIFYIGGIYLAMICGYGFWNLKITIAVSLLIVLFILFILVCRKPGFHTGWVSGILAILLIITMGFILMIIHVQAGDRIRTKGDFSGTALLEIREAVTETANSVKTIASVKKQYHKGKVETTRKKILLYLHKDSASLNLEPGDFLIAGIRTREIGPPANPYEFDYRRYLSVQSVYHQAYLSPQNWCRVDLKRKSFDALAYRMQKKLLGRYSEIGLNQTLYSILSALTLGYKSDLELHTKQIFAQAGVMHVMALSGFNVGIIAVVLAYILGFLRKFRGGEAVKFLVVILLIWVFVFVTGFSASVTRAAVMITFVLFGKLMHRKINAVNILAFSAFVILTFSPALISDVSFQLSFAAVFGIIVFYPLIYKALTVNNPVLNKLWQMFAISCAAQLATLPFTIYYFHQFPVYFWLTNLYVVPLVSFITCTAGVYLIFSFIPPLAFVIGKILSFLLHILYQGVSFTEVLPYALIDQISLSASQAVLLSIIILCLAMYLIFRRISFVYALLIIVLIFQGTLIKASVDRRNQRMLLVGNCKNMSLVNLVEGQESVILSRNSCSADDAVIKYALDNFWIHHGIKEHKFIAAGKDTFGYHPVWLGKNSLFEYQGKSVLILSDNHLMEYSTNHALTLDFLIITDGFTYDSKVLYKMVKPCIVVLDGSIGYKKGSMWKKTCEELNIDCWWVKEKGAYLVSL